MNSITLQVPADLDHDQTVEAAYRSLENLIGPRNGKATLAADAKAEKPKAKKAKAEKPKAKKAKAEKPAEEKQTEKPAPELTEAALKKGLAAVYGEKGKQAAIDILAKYDAAKLSDVPEENWPDLAVDLGVA